MKLLNIDFRIFKNCYKLIILTVTISFFLSVFVTFASIVLFPNQELSELKTQNLLLFVQIENLDKELSLMNKTIKKLDLDCNIQIVVKNPKENFKKSEKMNEQTKLTFIF
jgi:hypothetical protein